MINKKLLMDAGINIIEEGKCYLKTDKNTDNPYNYVRVKKNNTTRYLIDASLLDNSANIYEVDDFKRNFNMVDLKKLRHNDLKLEQLQKQQQQILNSVKQVSLLED